MKLFCYLFYFIYELSKIAINLKFIRRNKKIVGRLTKIENND